MTVPKMTLPLRLARMSAVPGYFAVTTELLGSTWATASVVLSQTMLSPWYAAICPG